MNNKIRKIIHLYVSFEHLFIELKRKKLVRKCLFFRLVGLYLATSPSRLSFYNGRWYSGCEPEHNKICHFAISPGNVLGIPLLSNEWLGYGGRAEQYLKRCPCRQTTNVDGIRHPST